MSVHSRHPWRPGDPVTDDLIQELVRCINGNRWGGHFTPPAFGIFSPADGLVLGFARLLDSWDGKVKFRDHVANSTEDADEAILEIGEKLIGLMQSESFLERPQRPQVPRMGYRTISVPKINRVYPEL